MSLASDNLNERVIAASAGKNSRIVADLIMEARQSRTALSTESVDAIFKSAVETGDFIPANLYLEHVVTSQLDKEAVEARWQQLFANLLSTAQNDAMSLSKLMRTFATRWALHPTEDKMLQEYITTATELVKVPQSTSMQHMRRVLTYVLVLCVCLSVARTGPACTRVLPPCTRPIQRTTDLCAAQRVRRSQTANL